MHPFSESERSPARLLARFTSVRNLSLALAAPLSAEDQALQSMPDASPTKWHLAHTSWFFETVVLQPHAPDYRPFDERFSVLFNSYYESFGSRHPRPQRGLLSRPSVAEISRYRAHVDQSIAALIDGGDEAIWTIAGPLIELGLHHEQQHQELMLTDIKHAFSFNPLLPAWKADSAAARAPAMPQRWLDFADEEAMIGHRGATFSFDNENPCHAVRLQPFALACRPVTCGEFLAFIEDGGYRRPQLWLSDGWAAVQSAGWQAPLYWRLGQSPQLFTLYGQRDLDPQEPVCHISFYEAAAYAEWAGARLPTEFEWEAAALSAAKDALPCPGLNPAHPDPHPRADAPPAEGLHQLFGAVWQWTRSSYDPYPGFRPLAGAVGEYNGKFMVGQLVLRGSSCATPSGHSRASYRNFFPPAARWQFSGLRLARDL